MVRRCRGSIDGLQHRPWRPFARTPDAETTLASLDHDEHATRVAAQIMRELWQPPPSNSAFPTTAQWADGLRRLRTRFDGGTGPFPRALVEIAELLFRELLASSEAPVLLHGDLHHFNILSSDRRP